MENPQDGGGATESSAEKLSELKDTAKQQASEVAATAKQEAKGVTRHAVVEGREVFDQAKAGLQDQARARTAEASQSLHRIAGNMQALADGRPQDAGPAASYVRQAATRVSGLAERVDREGFDGILEDVSEFGRRRPGAFLLAAGAAGFVTARLLRASSRAGTDGDRQLPAANAQRSAAQASPRQGDIGASSQPFDRYAGTPTVPIQEAGSREPWQ